MELLVRLLREFESDYNRFLREGAGSIVTRFESISSYAKGKRVRVTNGTESYAGTTAGLGPEGLLQVEREDGRVTAVISGDVTEGREMLLTIDGGNTNSGLGVFLAEGRIVKLRC